MEDLSELNIRTQESHFNKWFQEYQIKIFTQGPKYLNMKSPAFLIQMSIQEASIYVDEVTEKAVLSKCNKVLNKQMSEAMKYSDYQLKYISATAIGNIAYIGLNSTDSNLRDQATEMFNKLKDLHK